MEIKGFEDYLIFDDGSIIRQSTGKEIKGWINCEYQVVDFWIKGKGHARKKVHRLVAEAYLFNPDNLPVVDHINGVKTDNRVENLRWASYRQNTTNTKAKGVYKRKSGNYRAMVCNRGNVYSKTFATEDQALEWRRKMKLFCNYLA